MSRSYAHVSSNLARSAASLGVFCAIAFSSNLASAQPHKAKVDPRAYQAQSVGTPAFDRSCVAANGAQIWGGFAASDDLIDVRTGEICGKR
jgi:hypothetical protein